MSFFENLLNKGKIKEVMKITDQEALTKIAITENKNMDIVYQAISQITDQERLWLVAYMRMGKHPESYAKYRERFSQSLFCENLAIAERAIQSINDQVLLVKLVRVAHLRLSECMANQLSAYPDSCAERALGEYNSGTSDCCAYANKATRPDLVRNIFRKTSHGSVAKIAADKMSNEELMDVLLTDARFSANKNISGGKYDTCHISKYIFDRLSAQDIPWLARSAANEKIRELAQAILNGASK